MYRETTIPSQKSAKIKSPTPIANMATTTKSPNLDFAPLNSILSLYTPPISTVSTSSLEPTTIIFCSWMGVSSKSRYLNLFFSRYHALYPSARILHIASFASFFLHTPTSSRTALFKPIVSAIDSDSSVEKRILVHIISNGGTLSFADACQEYKLSTGKVLPVKAIILDSAPGESSYEKGYYALSMGFPKGIMYYPAAALVSLALGTWVVANNVFGMSTLVERSGERLNDWELVDESAKRLYIYSEADQLVGWEAVEEHAMEARRKGGLVRLSKFDGSAHVQHMLLNGEKYWRLIEEFIDM